MCSSRSDDVTKFVCLSVVILFDLEHLKYLKQYVSKVLQGCLIGVSGCLNGVLRVFQKYFKGVSRTFLGYLKGVSKVFQESFKGVSR